MARQKVWKVNITYDNDGVIGRRSYVIAGSGPANAMLNTLEAPEMATFSECIVGINAEEITGNILGSLE